MDQRIVGPLLLSKDKSDGVTITYAENRNGQQIRSSIKLTSAESFKLSTLLLQWIDQDWFE